tara:strand:+ start:94 stop:1050 length:957 start_codon:yes stop_codon:yes gene_type:complete
MEDTFAPATDTEQATPEVSQETPMTPESAFDATQDKGNLVDEFFRANKMDEEPSEAQQEPSPVEIPSEAATAEPTDVDNDVKRYQYWQSEADKARNENAEMAKRLEALENQAVSQPQPESIEQPEQEQFPEPPMKPQKPRGFSRQDAMDDPQSESAAYLDEVDNWRDNMDEYNRLHTQYTQAVVQEERERLVKEREDILRQQAEKEKVQQNMQQMGQHLSKTYGASPEEINQFVQVMDDPKNITVDNLFQLYRMQNGGGGEAPVTQTATNESFEQRKRAQQVPTPMGVVPSQSTSQQSGSDSVMDSMINDYKTKNPFG